MTVRYMIKLVHSDLSGSGYPNSLGASIWPHPVMNTTGLDSETVSQEQLSGPTWTGTGFRYPTSGLPQTVTDAHCDGIRWCGPFGDGQVSANYDYVWRIHNGMTPRPKNATYPGFSDPTPEVSDPSNPPNYPCAGLTFWEVQRDWLSLLFEDETSPVPNVPIGQLDQWIGGVKTSASNGLHPPPSPLPSVEPSPIVIVATCDDSTCIVRRSGGIAQKRYGLPMGRWPWIICQTATIVFAQQIDGTNWFDWRPDRQTLWDWLQANLP